jgi:hypothetical protein
MLMPLCQIYFLCRFSNWHCSIKLLLMMRLFIFFNGLYTLIQSKQTKGSMFILHIPPQHAGS